jgi:superfamily II DNA or RNA helicase
LPQGYLLCYVIPGGGKSSLPVITGTRLIAAGVIDKLCWITPREALQNQAAEAFQDDHLRRCLGGPALELNEATNEQDPSRGTAGYATTYQALAADASGINLFEFRRVTETGRRLRYALVLDKIHHVVDGGPFFRRIGPLWHAAALRLVLTGTLERADQKRIGFLDYETTAGSLLVPRPADITYPLHQALADQAVLPVGFRHLDARLSFLAADGQTVNAELSQATEEGAREQIWVALRTPYAIELLRAGLRHWKRWRRRHPRSRALVVCATKAQVRRLIAVLEEVEVSWVIATSDDADAARTIKRFRRHPQTAHVLVTVAMAYEGLDVPDLTHVICLTHIRSLPWIYQMLARVMRVDRHPDAGPYERQRAFAFVPDDPLMTAIVDQVRREQAMCGIADDR